MKICPTCSYEVMMGALFCEECGTQLIYSDGIPTSEISLPSSGLGSEQAVPAFPVASTDAYKTISPRITLNLVNSGETMSVPQRKETTLGRASEGQPIVPDVDLTPYKAYEAGVSRMHASIKIIENQVMVIDLGSSNGTRINGKKIAPHTPAIVHHGDILSLGKFKMQILIE